MANEAICIEPPRVIKRYLVSDVHTIPKGTLLRLSSADLYVVASSTSSNEVFAGISIEEKTANDGIGEIGVAIDGVWDITNNGSVTGALGQVMRLSGSNLIAPAVAADLLNGGVVGKLLEAAATLEVVRTRLGYI